MEDKFILVGAESSELTEHISKPALSFWQDAWRRLKLNKIAVVAMWLLIITSIFAILTLFFVPQSKANYYDPGKVSTYQNLPPKLGNLPIPGWDGNFTKPGESSPSNVYQDQSVPEGKSFLFGTDQYGRSIAMRTISGLRISLVIALAATILDVVIGVIYGIVSGWKGGKVDIVMQRIIEILSSVPNIIIITMLSLWMGQGILSIVLAMGLFSWTSMARQIRNMVLSYKERDFILAARTMGVSPFRIATRHLVPNLSGLIIVQVMMTIPSMIFYEAILSAINLGVKAPTASLGTLINDGITYGVLQYYPFQLIVPALALALLSLAFVLFGDGLRDAFDPKASED